jgi:magnesium-transporting ATPase (P-type)
MLTIEQLRDFDASVLKDVGGVDSLAAGLNSNAASGLSSRQAGEHRAVYGSNKLPDPELDTFWHFLQEALFEDTTLIILEVSAVVQLAFAWFVR